MPNTTSTSETAFADVHDSVANRVAFQAQLLDSVGQAIIATDTTGRITFWNRAAETLYGWAAEEVIGRLIVEVTPSDTSEELASEILAEVSAGRPWSGEFEVQRRDGTCFPAGVTDTPILDSTGAVVGVIGISSDLTERKTLEERFNRAQRLESLGLLAGGIAHDFNNLLTVVLNHAALIEGDAEPGVSARARQIRGAAESGARLTRQLLTYARREPVNVEDLDLDEMVSDMEELLGRAIGEDIELVVQLGSGVCVHADRSQLDQVLLNLAVNARDAMPSGGRLTIETATVDIDETWTRLHPELGTGCYVQLTVSDTGTGMAPEVLARACEPFFSTKPRGAGTGLGLATVYAVAREAGGTVNLYSEVGLGTTVRVYLPCGAAYPTTLQPKVIGAWRRLAGSVVLLVEDQPEVRSIAADLLRGHDVFVLEAESPWKALELAARVQFDLLLTDVVMPEMSGRALSELIAARAGTAPVLYMSGYTGDVLGAHCVLDSDIHLLQKPFTEVSLLAAVDDAIGLSRSEVTPGATA